MKKNKLKGIILLDGKQTIKGQIKARLKALKHCLHPDDSIYPKMRKAWIEDHIKTLQKLYILK